jgi:glycine cleavage system H protein
VIESVKAASDVYTPVGGEIVAVNDQVAESTGLINSSPYDKGWLFKIKPSNSSDFDALLDAEGYQEVID